MGDALHTHGGVTDAREARLAQAGLLAVHGPAALDARTGVLVGPGSTALVTGTAATAPMAVAVAPHHWASSRGSANGPYLGVLEAPTTVTIAAAPASGTRIDVVYVKQGDATPGIPTPDATTAPVYGAVTGTVGAGKPSLVTAPGAEELATVSVTAGATSTAGAGVVITNTGRQTVARGGVIPVRSKIERDAIASHDGQAVWRQDLRVLEILGTNPGVLRAVFGQVQLVRTGVDAAAGQTALTGGGPRGMHSAVVINQPFGAGVPFQGIVLAKADVTVQGNSEARLGALGNPGATGSDAAQNTTGLATRFSMLAFDLFSSGSADSFAFQPIFVAQVGTVQPSPDSNLTYSLAIVMPRGL